MRTSRVQVCRVAPLHEPTDAAKLGDLTVAMRGAGWQGRPLLVAVDGDGYQALTGSHRLAAAAAAGLTQVPALVIEDADLDADGWDYLQSLWSDGTTIDATLRELALDDAAALAAQG